MRPIRVHSQPITQATSRLPTNRASTISGLRGNATAVAVSTIGLIAGAESRNAIAAAGVTPRRTSAPATGTDAHSQPGRIAPAMPAIGTASTGFFGSARVKNVAGTNTAIPADSSTPSTRKGSACTTTATKTVIQLCITGADSAWRIGPCARTTTSSTMVSTSGELNCQPSFAASAGATGDSCAGTSGFASGFAC